jgi:hypothetical protein
VPASATSSVGRRVVAERRRWSRRAANGRRNDEGESSHPGQLSLRIRLEYACQRRLWIMDLQPKRTPAPCLRDANRAVPDARR